MNDIVHDEGPQLCRTPCSLLLIRHISSDKKCKDYVLNNCPILEPHRLAECVAADNALIRGNVRKGLPRFCAYSK